MNVVKTQVINDKVIVINPETDGLLEYAIVINNVFDGICINQNGNDIYIPNYAVKEVCKQMIKLTTHD